MWSLRQAFGVPEISFPSQPNYGSSHRQLLKSFNGVVLSLAIWSGKPIIGVARMTVADIPDYRAKHIREALAFVADHGRWLFSSL